MFAIYKQIFNENLIKLYVYFLRKHYMD